jgi:hypothetical protein
LLQLVLLSRSRCAIAPYIESIIIASKSVEQEVTIDLWREAVSSDNICILHISPYLWFDEDEVDEDHDEVVFDVFVGEALAARTLRQSHTFTLGAIISTTVGAIQV